MLASSAVCLHQAFMPQKWRLICKSTSILNKLEIISSVPGFDHPLKITLIRLDLIKIILLDFDYF